MIISIDNFMKTIRILVSLAAIYLACLNVGCQKSDQQELKSDPQVLKLWMTYEQVLKIVPHDRKKMLRMGFEGVSDMSEKDRKYLRLFVVDLEEERGLILQFNESLQLVRICRIESATQTHK